ncbi:Listeria/Bacterioides repeat-containing protein [Fibrobacter sp. UWB12]|nr:Listeria/Bacterioides repeat-containing protein [Fibrobacter sp. UWB12]
MKGYSSMTRIIMLISLVVGMGQVFAAWDGVSKEKPSKNTDDVFLIENEAQLAWLSDSLNIKESNQGTLNYKVNVKLMTDLDMGNHLFVPICGGGGDRHYTGVFDGNGHIISNLTINGETIAKQKDDPRYGQNIAFIGVLGAGGKVKDLVLEKVNIQSSTNIGVVGSSNQISVGAIVGWQQSGTIENCSAFGSIITSGNGQGVGGIVGNLHNGTITNCLSSVEIRASGKNVEVGGIVGLTKDNAVTIQSCVYEGSALESTETGHVGGIVGQQLGDKALVVESSFYNSEAADAGIGQINGENTQDGSKGVKKPNSEPFICVMNGGVWTESSGTCSITEGETWFTGDSAVSLKGYGADGFMVTFNANEGAFPAKAKKRKFIERGKTITGDEITTPVREGFAFAGWALTSDANEPASDLGQVNKVMTIYAVWKPVYAVTLSAAPGKFPNGNEEETVLVVEGERVSVNNLELPFTYTDAESSTKYYFKGWASESGALEALDVLPTITAEKTLYAVWNEAVFYTVAFNDNGRGKTVVDFVLAEEGQKIAAPEAPVPDEGYAFDGWYTESTCENKFNFESTVINENEILYAKWNKVKYDIEYHLDGGTNNAKNPASYDIDTETFMFEAPVKDGHVFKGWYYDAEFNEKATQVTKGTTGKKDLYAEWEATKYVIYYLAGPDAYGTLAPDTLVYGKSVKLKGKDYFHREEFRQVGWLNADSTKIYDLDAEYKENASIMLFPRWKALSYKITYELDGGVNNSANVDSYVDEDVEDGKVIELKSPFRCGYKFDGWYDNKKFTGSAVTQIKSGTEGNLTFYAKWNSFSAFKTYGAVKIYRDNGVNCAVMENGSKSKVNINSDIGVSFVSYDRKFPVNKTDDDKMYSTIVLPFTIAKSKVDGAEFYEFKGVANDGGTKKVQISLVEGDKIQANKPYIIRTTKEHLSFNIGDGESVVMNTSDAKNTKSTDGLWELRGMYSYKQWAAGDKELGFAYGYTAKATKNVPVGQFARNVANAYIYPFRAYLLYTPQSKISAPQKVASGYLSKTATSASIDEFALPETMEIVVVDGKQGRFGETAPAFNMWKSAPGQVKLLDGWFDMLGRKLKAKPTAKGIYYYNGKRVRIY